MPIFAEDLKYSYISNECKEPFAIEIYDTSEQITFIVRNVYVEFNIRERIIGYFFAEKTCAEHLMNNAISVLQKTDLSAVTRLVIT